MERNLFYWIFLFGCLHESSVKGKIVSPLLSDLPSRTEKEREIWEKSNMSVPNLRLKNWISYNKQRLNE